MFENSQKTETTYFNNIIETTPPMFSECGCFVISANGNKHALQLSKYIGEPNLDRLPYLKRVTARGQHLQEQSNDK